MSQPFFAICLPVFNGSTTIRTAIESVLQQTFADWQLNIIDNQSTDGTWELVSREYSSHPKIRLYRNKDNFGMRGNLNRCLEEAHGSWMGILPHDDAYRLHALETIHAQLATREDVVLWAHGEFAHCGGYKPNAVPIFNHVTEFQAGDLAELLYKRGNIFGVLSSYFIDLARAREGGVTFADGEMFVDLRFYVRLLKQFPTLRAIYWPDLLVCVNTDENTESHQLARSGKAQLDLVKHMGALAPLGWKKSTLAYQLLRLAKCSFKYRRQLQALHAFGASRESARALLAQMFSSRAP